MNTSLYKHFLFIGLIALSISSLKAQSPVPPLFESNVNLKNGTDSLIKAAIPEADIIIAYRIVGIWRLNKEYKLLCLKQGHWYKYFFDASRPVLSAPYGHALTEKATNDSTGRMFYDKLLMNNLLAIEDDTRYPACNAKDTVIHGKHVYISVGGISDGAECNIWIITKDRSRFLDFYAPDYYLKYCPPGDRKQALKIIDLFNNEW